MSPAALGQWLWHTGWQVALLIVIVLVVQRVLRRVLSPRASYGLWLLVVLRLCLPGLPETTLAPVSWSSVRSAPEPRSLPLDAWAGASVARPPARAARAPHAVVRAPSPPGPVGATGPAPVRTERARRSDGAVHLSLAGRPASAEVASVESSARSPLWPRLLIAGWLLGALFVLVRAVRGERAFRRVLVDSCPATDPHLLAIHETSAAALALRRAPPLVLTSALSSPALYGLWRPRVLLPVRTARELDDAGLRHVLLHELAHHKRRDLWLAALLLPLRALWWFHPLVHLAFARLRADQESARDHEALSATASPAPLAYARTLLALLEEAREGPQLPHAAFLTGRGDLKKRIQMIANFRRVSPLTRSAGVCVCAGLAWVTLLSAAQEASVPGPVGSTARAASDLKTIEVERPSPAAAWKTAIRASLETDLDAKLREVDVYEALAWFRAATGLNLVISPALADEGPSEIDLETTGTTARQVLNLICDLAQGAEWVLHRQAIFVGVEGSLPVTTDLRFYKVAPILDQVDHEEREDWLIDVATLVQEYTGAPLYSWELEGVSIQPWDELLIIRQNDATHAQVHALLNRILNRGAEPEYEVPAWRRQLDSLLARKISIQTEDAELQEVATQLSVTTGATFVVEPQVLEEVMDEGILISLNLADMELRTLLEWIHELTGAHAVPRDGVFVFTRHAPMRLEFYDIDDIERSVDDAGEVAGMLEDLVRNTIAPHSWEEDPRCSACVRNGVFLVNQSPEVQAQVASLIESMRRALQD